MLRIIDSENIPWDRRYKDDDYKDIPSDFETDKIDDLIPFKHDGYMYSPASLLRGDHMVCDKTKLADMEDVDAEYVNDITCPYCGYAGSDSWKIEADSGKEDCEHCGSTYSFERIVTVEYCSKKVKKYELKEI